MTDLAGSEQQLLRCHNLVWHSQLAPWVTAGPWDKANFTAMLRRHVAGEAGHWRGRCYAWDVVNEALLDDGSFRDSVFYQVLGPEYLSVAFEEAARADPEARLYYNDYNIESPGPKQRAVLDIVRRLRRAGLHIDGVGLQSHFLAGQAPTLDQQLAAMESYTAIGLEVAQTELDIRLQLPADAASLEQQRLDYMATVGACMQTPRCVGTTVWDFYDPVCFSRPRSYMDGFC